MNLCILDFFNDHFGLLDSLGDLIFDLLSEDDLSIVLDHGSSQITVDDYVPESTVERLSIEKRLRYLLLLSSWRRLV